MTFGRKGIFAGPAAHAAGIALAFIASQAIEARDSAEPEEARAIASRVRPAMASGSNRAALLERRLAAPDGQVMIIAHRGCWKNTSENSLDAIEACIEAGIDMVELDVRATRDGMLILMHDSSVNRTTNGRGRVSRMDWEELRQLRLREGRGGSSRLTERRVPTLEEALRVARGRILINLDPKVELSSTLLAQIEAYGRSEQVLFKMHASRRDIVEAAPWIDSVPFQPVMREREMRRDVPGSIAEYDALTPVSYEINFKHPDFVNEAMEAVRERCARFWINSLRGRVFDDEEALADPEAVWGSAIAMGVDAIQTDEPLALKSYLTRTGTTTRACTRS